jgi:hypothetical protein
LRPMIAIRINNSVWHLVEFNQNYLSVHTSARGMKFTIDIPCKLASHTKVIIIPAGWARSIGHRTIYASGVWVLRCSRSISCREAANSPPTASPSGPSAWRNIHLLPHFLRWHGVGARPFHVRVRTQHRGLLASTTTAALLVAARHTRRSDPPRDPLTNVPAPEV